MKKVLIYLLLCLFTIPIITFAANAEYKLVLIGVVVQKNTEETIGGAKVELEEFNTGKIETTYTQVGGNFYFKLKPETQYKLRTISESNSVEDNKIISTIGKNDSEILYAILEWTSHSTENVVQEDNFNIKKNKATAKSVIKRKEKKYPPNNMEYIDPNEGDITYKIEVIQILKNQRVADNYFSKIGKRVNPMVEKYGDKKSYMLGSFDDYPTAEGVVKSIKKKGYDKAKVIAYSSKNERLKKPAKEVARQHKAN